MSADRTESRAAVFCTCLAIVLLILVGLLA